ncbi:hypothetical protein BKA62DRAFT_741091 [Auriculariales sp. MPI-PUGE-AT-0066]|nr:hypothetical protein BKA62DRAFT_628823 [Auriculariales sp. MPI-PUGE-AT-0066]KAH7105827.1 hypothetical protein BKA62DRAFT_741091 [Auriculariales sp. MPI-PUGE-AT-0066]
MPTFDLSGLKSGALFMPIPNTDPLTALLTKHVPELEKRPHRDLSGTWQKSDVNTLVMTNNWRALATMARDRIVMSTQDPITVLGLWHLRLTSLARLRLYNQVIAECTNLFNVLHGVEPAASRTFVFDHIVPFELHVMQARLKYWSADSLGYLDELGSLLQTCKARAKISDREDMEMWKERAARICLMLATQLLEMKNFTAATRLLEPLAPSSPLMRSAVARIYLQSGQMDVAEKHIGIVKTDAAATESTKALNAAFLAVAKGEWLEVQRALAPYLEKDPENAAVANNLAVALLALGKVTEATEILESSLQMNPAAITAAEPILFNIATLYELRSTTATEKKRDLLIEVSKWSGDGLRTTCLKLPTS